MAARKSANAKGVRKIKAVFVKFPLDGGAKYRYFRQPFNIIEYDWGNGERATYMELVLGNRHRSYSEASECYDEVLFLDPRDLAQWPVIDQTQDYPR